MSKNQVDPRTVSKDKAVQIARSQANSEVIEQHRKVRDARIAELLAEWGHGHWAPAPTKAEKAAAEIERLLSENPELAEAYAKVEAKVPDQATDQAAPAVAKKPAKKAAAR